MSPPSITPSITQEAASRPPLQVLFQAFEIGFTIFSLMIYAGAVLSLIVSGGASEGEQLAAPANVDSSFVLLIFQGIYLITFVLLVARWKIVLWVLLKDKLNLALILLAVLSIVWSLDPRLTFVRCVALIGTSLSGLYLATRYTLEEQIKLLAWTFGIIVVLSALGALALPRYGIMAGIHAGAWRGVFLHKNVLGKMMSLGLLVFLTHLMTHGPKRGQGHHSEKIMWLGCLGLAALLLILAKSTGALINSVVLLAAFGVTQLLKFKYEILVPSLLSLVFIGASLAFFITENFAPILKLVGKDPSLTGRTDFWSIILDNISQHPWIGHGYGAFWGESSPQARLIRYAVGWEVPNAHNGVLDLWLDLGGIGVVLLLLGVGVTFMTSLTRLRQTKSAIYLWPILFIVVMILVNLAETTLMVRNDIFWMLYTAIAFSVQLPTEKPKTHEINTFSKS